MKPSRAFAPLFLSVVLLCACSTATRAPQPAAPPTGIAATEPAAADGLDALVWYQSAEESRRLKESIFVAATAALDRALADPSWSALGQGAEAARLPLALIADIDETLLDGSALQARFLADGIRFDERTFAAWVRAAEAPPLPGALDFSLRAQARGVTLFYVTNRDAPVEAATRRNLARVGFPITDQRDAVLCRGERPDWGSDKESRRAEIARSFRVLLLLGDDLNDFVSGVREAGLDERSRVADAFAARWGVSWFLLPNPLYGSWERALVGAAPQSRPLAEVRSRKHATLRRFAGELEPTP